MKNYLALALSAVLSLSILVGWSPTTPATTSSGTNSPAVTTPQSAETTKPEETTIEPLVVAVQSQYCSAMMQTILDEELDDKYNVPVELLVFDGGPPINEAVGEWDVAITGGAFIYALANYDCHLIAHQCDGTGPDGIYAREGDPILDVLGDFDKMAEIIRGKTILTNLGTTSHYILIHWLEQLGLETTDVNLISQAFDNGHASWLAGEGDYAVQTSPYSFKTEAAGGFVKLADFDSIGALLFESTVCSDEAYNEKYDQVVKFVAMLYEATDILASDPQKHFDTAKAWYVNNGRQNTDEDIQRECDSKWMMSIEYASEMDLKKFATGYGEFYIANDLIEPNKLDTIIANIASDVHSEAIALLGK